LSALTVGSAILAALALCIVVFVVYLCVFLVRFLAELVSVFSSLVQQIVTAYGHMPSFGQFICLLILLIVGYKFLIWSAKHVRCDLAALRGGIA
jgi:hypothetical protein